MANVEALWSMEFDSDTGIAGRGIVVFETGRVFGGDNGWHYIGNYEVRDRKIEGYICVKSDGVELATIFGHIPGESLEIDLVGGFEDGDTIRRAGTVVGISERTMKAIFKRLGDLP